MYYQYLTESDQLQSNHFPVIAYLNEASNCNFKVFLEYLSQGVGSGYDYSVGSFWADLDAYEQAQMKQFEGLLIETIDGRSIVLPFETMRHYLNLVAKRYCEKHPEEKAEIEVLVQQCFVNKE